MLCVTLFITHFGRKNSDVRKEHKVSGESAARPAWCLDYYNGHPTYFDVSVRSARASTSAGVLSHSAITPRFATLRGEMEKDA